MKSDNILKNTKIVTLENMNEIGSVSDAIEWAMIQYGDYPNKPRKPSKSDISNSIEARKYADDLEKWEIQMEVYHIELENYRKNKSLIDSTIIEFIKEKVGISIVPEQYRNNLWSKAWEDGHAGGFYEVYLRLNSLIEIFE